MATWKPSIPDGEGPLYLAIANSIADDIARGKLEEGERLPPQRDLADELKVALTTVTRAYTEAERRGLVTGEVGRGTFVLRKETFGPRHHQPEPSAVDLTVNSLLPHPEAPELIVSMTRVLTERTPGEVLEYQSHHASFRHREAGTHFLAKLGVRTTPDNVLVTSGAQHAMTAIFSTLTNPGDTVLTAEHTYAGMKSLANFLHIRLRGLLMDEEGIRSDAFEAACATTNAKALYCMPSLQNPTATVMSEDRRREIVAIAESYKLAVVEDDSYGFLLTRQKPLCSLASSPSRFFYLTSTSKSLLPGLRIGFVHAPASVTDRLAAAIFSTVINPTPPMAAVVSSWIGDGTADRIMEWKREEVAARQRLARQILGGFDYRAHPASPHGWLMLPEPWCARDFVEQARMRGVLVSPAEDFIVARSTSAHAVRICLGPVRERKRLREGLSKLKDVLDRPPAPCQTIV